MPDPIPTNNISADLIRSNWYKSGQFSISEYRNLQVWDARSNPSNSGRPYGITNLPSPTIRFSDFRGKVEMYFLNYCIISGGGGGGTPVLTTGGVFSGYAGGGGGGGRVISGVLSVPNGGNINNWNRLDVVVGAGGAGGSASNNGTPYYGGGSYIRQYYTTPSSTQQLENYILSRGGGSGASVSYLAGSQGTGGGGSSFGYNNQGNPPGTGDASNGGYGQGSYFTNANFRSLAGGGGGAGGNGYNAISSFGDPSQVKAGQGGLPVELSAFLGTDPSPYGNVFGAQNRAGGGGGGGAFSRGGDVVTYSTIRAPAQLGGGGAGAAESEVGGPADNPAVHGYVSAEDGREYRGGGGGGGAGVYVYNGGNGGSGSIIITYRNIDNNQRGVGGTVYERNIFGIDYYVHVFYGSGSFYFYS